MSFFFVKPEIHFPKRSFFGTLQGTMHIPCFWPGRSWLRSRFTGRISGSFLLGVGRSLGWKPFWKHVLDGRWRDDGWWMKVWYAVINMYLYNIHFWNLKYAPIQSQRITQKKNRNFRFLLILFTNGIIHNCFKSGNNQGSTSKIGLSFRGHSASWRSKSGV